MVLQEKAKPKVTFIPSTSNTSSKGKKQSTFDRSKKCGHYGKVGHEEVDYFKIHWEKEARSLYQGKKKKKEKKTKDLIDTFDELNPTLVLINTKNESMDLEGLFTFILQVK